MDGRARLVASPAAQILGQPAFEFGGDAAVNENTLGRHASRAGVEPQPEGQRANHEVEVGVGADQHGVAAAQLHRRGNQVRRELSKDVFARGRRAGEQDFVRARPDGAAGGFAGFGQQRDELRVEAGADDQLGQRVRGGRSADARLEQHGIAGSQRLDELHAREQQRVIARPDDENDAERFAVNLAAHTGEPKRPATPAEAARGQHPSGFAFEEPTGLGERENFRGQGFERRTLPGGGGSFGQLRRVFSDEPAELANQLQAASQRRARPTRLGRASRRHGSRDSGGHVGIGVVEDDGNARWFGGSVHGLRRGFGGALVGDGRGFQIEQAGNGLRWLRSPPRRRGSPSVAVLPQRSLRAIDCSCRGLRAAACC